MKRGLKVKSGVRAPAPILHSTDVDVDKPIPYVLADNPPCPNNKPGDGCWYCIMRGAK